MADNELKVRKWMGSHEARLTMKITLIYYYYFLESCFDFNLFNVIL